MILMESLTGHSAIHYSLSYKEYYMSESRCDHASLVCDPLQLDCVFPFLSRQLYLWIGTSICEALSHKHQGVSSLWCIEDNTMNKSAKAEAQSQRLYFLLKGFSKQLNISAQSFCFTCSNPKFLARRMKHFIRYAQSTFWVSP